MQAKVVWVGLLVAFMLHMFQPCGGHAQTRQRPLSVSEVEELLQVGVSPQRVGAIVTHQGVNFRLTAPIRARLTKVGADAALLQLIKASTTPDPPPVSPPPPPSLAKHAPIIARRLPDEQQIVIQQGTSRAFLAEATDADNDGMTYSWEVDNQPVSASGMHFTFTPQSIGTHLVRLTVTDTDGLATAAEWSVQVQPRAAQIRLVMFTPHARHFSLFPHQFRFFAVQVEVPGWPEPALQYAWQVNGQPVSDNDIFGWQDPPLGTNEIQVTVATPSGQQLTHEWTVEVRGPKKNETIPPVWWPRTQVSGRGNIMTAERNQTAIPLSGKVRNYDAERAAENIIVEVTILDPNGQQLARHIAIPSPQPLPPEHEGSFQLSVANRYSVARFRYRTIGKDATEEDPKKLKERLVQRADQAQQAGKTAEAIALLETAIQVYPPDIRQLETRLRALQKDPLGRPVTH